METFVKIDENTISITAEVKEPEVFTKDLKTLQDELQQAKDSLVYVQQRHSDEIAPIQKTIDLLAKRLSEAEKLGIEIKPEAIKEIIEKPIKEEIIIK